MSYEDVCALRDCQRALTVLQPLMDRRDELSDVLSEVWNALLDARFCIVRKVLGDPLVSGHGLLDDVRRALHGLAHSARSASF
jgi:hypothetical protein